MTTATAQGSVSEIPTCPAPDTKPRAPAWTVPPDACDSHAHVFDAARFTDKTARADTPPDNGVDRLLALRGALGLSRGVVVAASVHGTGSHAVLDAAAADPGFAEFLTMLRDGLFWVKLTGLCRVSTLAEFRYGDAQGMARAVLGAAPGRTLWSSDWPHPHHDTPMPNDGDMLGLLADWAPDPALRHAVLVDNPARLYGFAASSPPR